MFIPLFSVYENRNFASVLLNRSDRCCCGPNPLRLEVRAERVDFLTARKEAAKRIGKNPHKSTEMPDSSLLGPRRDAFRFQSCGAERLFASVTYLLLRNFIFFFLPVCVEFSSTE